MPALPTSARPLMARAVAVAAVVAALIAPSSLARADSESESGPRRPGVTQPLRAGQAWMGWSVAAQSAASTAVAAPPATLATVTQTPGVDVSSWDGTVDWASRWSSGRRFAYVKATEGTTYVNPYFAQQYTGSYQVGMIRGAYHFARPDRSTGRVQADFFATKGGAWSADGRTLPGTIDLESNPYGAMCYGLTKAQMTSWIADFLARYKARTGRYAVIYTTNSWWTTCTGNTTQFTATSPLWVARWATTPGTLPAKYPYYTFWQYSNTPYDKDYFNGDLSRLRALALG
jgi:GH25 family lysozyme M1 (1,4-beta-N-acetylmuramidase)